ncbi:acyl-CoA dehydrogenase family protein [Mycolicibacterium sp. XJ2546]
MSSDLLEDLRKTTRQALTAGGGDVVDQLDLVGLLLDGQSGGLGMGEREMVLVGEEIGRQTAPSAFLPSVILAATLLSHGNVDGIELTKELAGNRYAVALAGLNTAATAMPPAAVVATGGTGGWLLDGTSWGLAPPCDFDAVLVVAVSGPGLALFVADGTAATVTADQLDPSRGLVEVTLERAPARIAVEATAAAGALRAAYRRAVLTVAAEQLGVARACLEMAVEHAKTRNQFGAPIGSFQAIKHRCAEVLLDAEFADAAIQQAIQTTGFDDLELAFLVATRAAVSAAQSCIHVHGGIGFTWEHPAHWYLRRAKVNATLFGPPSMHRNAIAESVGVNAAGRK